MPAIAVATKVRGTQRDTKRELCFCREASIEEDLLPCEFSMRLPNIS